MDGQQQMQFYTGGPPPRGPGGPLEDGGQLEQQRAQGMQHLDAAENVVDSALQGDLDDLVTSVRQVSAQ